MFASTTKTLALAIVSGGILAATLSTPSLAMGGGGGGGEGPGVRPNCHAVGCPHLKKKFKKVRKARKKKARRKGRSRPWASSFDPNTGRRITAIGNGDGSRTVIGIGAGFGPLGIQIWTSP